MFPSFENLALDTFQKPTIRKPNTQRGWNFQDTKTYRRTIPVIDGEINMASMRHHWDPPATDFQNALGDSEETMLRNNAQGKYTRALRESPSWLLIIWNLEHYDTDRITTGVLNPRRDVSVEENDPSPEPTAVQPSQLFSPNLSCEINGREIKIGDESVVDQTSACNPSVPENLAVKLQASPWEDSRGRSLSFATGSEPLRTAQDEADTERSQICHDNSLTLDGGESISIDTAVPLAYQAHFDSLSATICINPTDAVSVDMTASPENCDSVGLPMEFDELSGLTKLEREASPGICSNKAMMQEPLTAPCIIKALQIMGFHGEDADDIASAIKTLRSMNKVLRIEKLERRKLNRVRSSKRAEMTLDSVWTRGQQNKLLQLTRANRSWEDIAEHFPNRSIPAIKAYKQELRKSEEP
ncbi:hypothetical protein MMC25_004107 [Agyrium rufum]|nr:hypothetical protein [Agyrium rufum]